MNEIRASEFLDKMLKTAAIAAISPSSLRNQGVPNIIKCTRDFLSQLQLETFVVSDKSLFDRRLDEETDNLLDRFSVDRWPWGTARKALNLFLRDSLYNKYLCEHYNLHGLESWLEVPLDSAVANGLKRRTGRGYLPPWPGLKYLTKGKSDEYQAFALSLAEQSGIARVHLDLYLWLESR